MNVEEAWQWSLELGVEGFLHECWLWKCLIFVGCVLVLDMVLVVHWRLCL